MDNKMDRLSAEEKELFNELRTTDSFKIILKVLSLLIRDQEKRVMQMDLSQITDRDLSLAKARAEGADKLARDFYTYSQKVK